MELELNDDPANIARAREVGLVPVSENGKRIGRPPGSKNKVREDIPVSVPGPQTEHVSALEIDITSVTNEV